METLKAKNLFQVLTALVMKTIEAPCCFAVSLLQIANVLAYAVFLFTSGIGGSGLFGVPRIGDTSRAFPVTVSPAGYAFSIWSLIFVMLGVLCFMQALPCNREWSAGKIGLWWFLNAGVGEGLWPFAFGLRWGGMWVSAFLLAFIVFTAAGLYLQMNSGVAPLSDERSVACASHGWRSLLHRSRPSVSVLESLVLQGAVGIYMGWTSCATIVNISIALKQSGVDEDPVTAPASVLVVFAAAALALLSAATRTDFFYSGAVCWALTAIYSNQKRLGAPETAVKASLVAAILAGIAAGVSFLWRGYMLSTGRLSFAPLSMTLGGRETVEGAKDKEQRDNSRTMAPPLVENIVVGIQAEP